MKSLVEKLRDCIGKKPAANVDMPEHPNFWMYG